jgi:hypothetical protein
MRGGRHVVVAWNGASAVETVVVGRIQFDSILVITVAITAA